MAAEQGPDTERVSSFAIERAARTVAAGLVIAAAIVGIAISSRPSPPHYQAFALGDRIVRVDTKTGSIMSCEGQKCTSILRHGQHIELHTTFGSEKPAAAPALPAPAPAKTTGQQ